VALKYTPTDYFFGDFAHWVKCIQHLADYYVLFTLLTYYYAKKYFYNQNISLFCYETSTCSFAWLQYLWSNAKEACVGCNYFFMSSI